MPWYVTAYVAALIALGGMSWQMSTRLGLPVRLRNGDALMAVASIILTIAYWHERWRLALGSLAIPIFVASIAWLVYSIRPIVELSLQIAASTPGRTESTDRIGVYVTCVISLLVAAPALFWGLRVARAALGV